MISERLIRLHEEKEISPDMLLQRLDLLMSKEQTVNEVFVINVSGASAAGKSTISANLSLEIPDCSVLSMDNYLRGWEIGPLNHDSGDPNKPYFAGLNPNVYDLEQLHKDVVQLKEGRSIEKPIFDEVNKKPSELKVFKPSEVLVLEGIYSLESPFLELGNILILIEASLHSRLMRKIVRNSVYYGENTNNIMRNYLTRDEPTYPFYQESLRAKAKLIVNNPLDPMRDFDGFPEQKTMRGTRNVHNVIPRFECGVLHPEEQLELTELGDNQNLLTYIAGNKLLINDVIDCETLELLKNYYEVK